MQDSSAWAGRSPDLEKKKPSESSKLQVHPVFFHNLDFESGRAVISACERVPAQCCNEDFDSTTAVLSAKEGQLKTMQLFDFEVLSGLKVVAI